MNKLTLIFTALRVYRQARGQEGSTIRGVISGTLAAGAVVGLWCMGADMDAQQIGLVLAAIAGIDSVLKIVMPDKIGDNDGKPDVSAFPPIEPQGRACAGDAGASVDAVCATDGMHIQPVPADRSDQRARRSGGAGTASPERGGWNG